MHWIMKKSIFLILMGVFFLLYVACVVLEAVKGNTDAAVGFGCCAVLVGTVAYVSIDARDYRDKFEAALDINKELSELNNRIILEAQDINQQDKEILRQQQKLIDTINVLKTYVPTPGFNEINQRLEDTVFARDEEGEWQLYYKNVKE